MSNEMSRAEVAAQALTDYFEPMRGHPSEYTEVELGQAEKVIAALDKYDAENDIIRVQVDDEAVKYAALFMAAARFPTKHWGDLLPEVRALFQLNAKILLTTLSTRKHTKTARRKQKQGPPCMSCGGDKNEPAPEKCKDTKNHG